MEGLERLDGFKGLGAGKQQAWTPRRSHGCGLGRSDGSGRGVAAACVGGRSWDACWLKVARVLTFWGFGGFGGFGAFGAFGGFGGFGGFRGWQTASLDAHKKPWMWPWDACWLRRPGERHTGPPRRSDGSGLGVAVACNGTRDRPEDLDEAMDLAVGSLWTALEAGLGTPVG